MNYLRFFNKLSLARQPSPIRVLTAILQDSPPTMISMAGGMPNVDTFPIKSATVDLVDGTKLDLDVNIIRQALQYSPTPGIPGLLKWMKTLQEDVHKIHTLAPTENSHDILITNGSQDGICKTFEMMVKKGDNVLVETPTYSGTLAALKPLGCRIIPVGSDNDGLVPSLLSKALSMWEPSEALDAQSDIPKLLYLIPNGGNPTGHGLTEERKKEIYEIAQKYNILILEDDPYFYVQFKRPYVPSLLSMDDDRRVIRFDSFSKLISSGMRIGSVTGAKPITDRISLHMQASVMHASGLSQVVLYEILKNWGHEGFHVHASRVTEFYRTRKEQCIQAAEKHLKGLAEWSEPTGGMFLWLKVNVPDTYKMITVKARAKEVLFVPGNAFQIDDSLPCQFIRASYSLCSAEDMDMAFERLAALIREEQTSIN